MDYIDKNRKSLLNSYINQGGQFLCRPGRESQSGPTKDFDLKLRYWVATFGSFW